VLAEAGGASVREVGGRRDRRQLFPGPEFERWDPPGSSSRHCKRFSLTMGIEHHDGKRPPMTRDLRSGRRELQGNIASIFVADAPQNAEEDFPQRFPSSRRGFRSFTPFFTHTHRRWGSIGNRGIAADRDRRGGEVVRDSTVATAQYVYGYGIPYERASLG